MGAISVLKPFDTYYGNDGIPLENGMIYIGIANQNPETNPIAVYFDDALTIPASQPIRTISGYPVYNGSPARLYASVNDYSMTVRDSRGLLVFSSVSANLVVDASAVIISDAGSYYTAETVEDALQESAEFVQSGAGAVTRTKIAKMREIVSVTDFGAVGDGVTDDTTAIQNAVNAGGRIHFPAGTYKVTATIALSSSKVLVGDGWGSSIVEFWDCDGVKSNAGTNRVQIEKLNFTARNAVGAYDPKVRVGIWSAGAAGNTNSWLVVRDTYLRGWATCIYMQYTWNSCIDNVDTSFCTYGINLFGQSVNNSISNSRIGANTGTASIYLQADGATIGEGLMVTNSLLAEGVYGITSNNGFLSLNMVNCVVDLISDTAFNLADFRSSSIVGCWVYAANYGIKLVPLGSPAVSKLSLTNNVITVTSTTGVGVSIGGNNYGIAISGGSITCSTNGYCVYADGNEVNVTGVYLINPSSNASIYFANADSTTLSCTGNTTITQPDTFTPTIIGDVVAGTGTYTTQFGSYYKIGRLVFFELRVIWTAHTGSNNIRVAGLPYPCKNVTGYAPKATIYAIDLTYSNQLVALVNTGASTIELREMSSGGGAAPVAMDTTGELRITGFYEAES